MRNYLITLFCIFIVGQSASQISKKNDLDQKLNNNQKFYDQKSIIENYYQDKIKSLSLSDSVERKKCLRELKKWNRKLWYAEYYVNESGRGMDPHKINLSGMKEVIKMPKLESNDRYQPNYWTMAGPSQGDNGLGRIDELAFHPFDSNIIFAGSPSGGLFKTTNAGLSWDAIGDFLPSLGISGVVIHPTDPNIIYILTGDGHSGVGSLVNAYLYMSSSAGVFKSIDGGETWLACGNLPVIGNYTGRELIIDPQNPNQLIAATSKGIYKTINGGITWTLTQTGNIYDIKYKPNNSNIVYATDSTSFFRSVNGGNTFVNINQPNLPQNNRISIGVTPANPEKVVLFAGPAIDNNSFQGLFISNNSGLTFLNRVQTPNLFYNFIGIPVLTDQSTYDNCIAISPVNENEIFVGGICTWRSNDGGFTWSQASAYWPNDNPKMHPDIQVLKYNPNTNFLFCGNDGGIYRLEYNGEWTFLSNGLNCTQFYHFERENDEGDIWGGAQDNGILEQNGGTNFYNYHNGDGYDMMTDHDYLVYEGEGNDVFYSVNEKIYADGCGSTCDISVPNNTNFFANLAMSQVYEDRIYAGYASGLWYSSNAGSSWSLQYSQPANWAVATTSSTDDVYYAGVMGNVAGIFRNGTNITPPLPYINSLKITDIDVHRQNNNTLVISVAGNTANSKVFYTTNGGVSWTNYSLNLPNVPVFSVKIDGNGGIYAGTSIGVFYKAINLNYWQSFSNGLPPVPVTEIELWPVPFPVDGNQPSNPPTSPEIWVSTFGRGLWFTQQYQISCPNSHNLSNDVKGVLLTQANEHILSTQKIKGGIGTDVRYRAGTKIRLLNGFKVENGSYFKATIEACNNP